MSSNTQIAGPASSRITTGYGYITRIRRVTPKGECPSQSHLACDVTLLEKGQSETDGVLIDCVITGENARQVILRHFTNFSREVVTPEAAVCATVDLGVITSVPATGREGQAGHPGARLRSNLLDIRSLTIEALPVPMDELRWVQLIGTAVPVVDEVDEGDRSVCLAGMVETRALVALVPTNQDASRRRKFRWKPFSRKPRRPAHERLMMVQFVARGYVRLSEKHPEFEVRRSFLEKKGFCFDRERKAWVHSDCTPKSA